jgi:hypothetical protein
MLKNLLFIFILSSCTLGKGNKKLSKNEVIERQILSLQDVRPLLASDEFPFMKCEKIKSIQVEKKTSDISNLKLWQSIGHLELREQARQLESNIMSLKDFSFGEKHRFTADIYQCENTNSIHTADPVGMCKPSEERMFYLSYPSSLPREVGEQILRQKVRYYGIEYYFKTYNIRDIHYSFTKKQFSAKAIFFKCL